MSRHYLERGGQAVPVTLLEWAEWFEHRKPGESWQIAKDEFDGWTVSTVFIGLDHSMGEGPPLIYETLANGPNENEHGNRYSTRQQAIAGHAEIIAAIKAGTHYEP